VAQAVQGHVQPVGADEHQALVEGGQRRLVPVVDGLAMRRHRRRALGVAPARRRRAQEHPAAVDDAVLGAQREQVT
jgi:hypothetical protein